MSEKRFPIQNQRGAKAHPASISWASAELAYSVYNAEYGFGCQTLERLAERGGFAPSEMDMFLPGWRERESEITHLREALETANNEHADCALYERGAKDQIEKLEAALLALQSKESEAVKALMESIEEAKGTIDNGARAHDCLGFDCAQCGASGASGILEHALSSQPVPIINAAVNEIASERQRQKSVEGWSEGHDDDHDGPALSDAAACYAADKGLRRSPSGLWPWDVKWWKPTTHRRNLIKAGALIVAEIERLDRIEAASTKEK